MGGATVDHLHRLVADAAAEVDYRLAADLIEEIAAEEHFELALVPVSGAIEDVVFAVRRQIGEDADANLTADETQATPRDGSCPVWEQRFPLRAYPDGGQQVIR